MSIQERQARQHKIDLLYAEREQLINWQRQVEAELAELEVAHADYLYGILAAIDPHEGIAF